MNLDESQPTEDQPNDGSSVFARTVKNFYAVEAITPRNHLSRREGRIRRLTLTWKCDNKERHAILYPGQSASFGRSKTRNDIPVSSDPCLSGKHFQVECSQSEMKLIDLNSRNGTYVNGNEIRSAALFDRDQIIAGTTAFDVQIHCES